MSAGRWIALGAAFGLMTAAGCGGGQTHGAAFDSAWAYDGGAAIADIQQQLASAPIPRGADVAVGVVDDPLRSTLVGVPLGGGPAWSYAHALDARPVIAGAVVVGMGRGELFALEATTGRLLWRRAAAGRLRGAGDDGSTTVVSLMSRTGRGSMVLAITHDGEVLRQLEDDEAIGAPAVMGRYAFLPWQGQYVTVFDLLRGEEVARALLRTKVSRAFMTGGAMFFGGAAATRLDERIRFGAEDRASTVALPARELPGMPRWITPGIEVQGPAATALDKTQIYARPTASGPPAIEGRRFAATYFRVAVGFDATSGEVAWAHVGEADYLGGAAYSGGFALCDARGEVSLLEAQLGRVAGSVSLGRPVDACVVQADGITGKAGVAAEPLWRQLDRVVAAPDAELAAIQRFLLRELAALPDEEVTRALVTLASGERGSPALLEDARRALAGRRNGATFMLAALSRRYDFLAGALKPPPVGPLADALAAMGERKAAPLLAAHLLDPATSPGDVERAAAALVTLAGPAELSALRNFFAMYRGLDDNEALGEAVVRVAEALVQVGAANVVARAAKDPFTSPALRERIEAALRGKRAAQ